jgi:hypothetical protein
MVSSQHDNPSLLFTVRYGKRIELLATFDEDLAKDYLAGRDPLLLWSYGRDFVWRDLLGVVWRIVRRVGDTVDSTSSTALLYCAPMYALVNMLL